MKLFPNGAPNTLVHTVQCCESYQAMKMAMAAKSKTQLIIATATTTTNVWLSENNKMTAGFYQRKKQLHRSPIYGFGTWNAFFAVLNGTNITWESLVYHISHSHSRRQKSDCNFH